MARRHACDTTRVAFDQYSLAFLVAILCGALAFSINANWPIHDCGNRYCRHVARDDELERDV